MYDRISFSAYYEKENGIIHMKKYREGKKDKLHVHDFLEIGYVLSGRGNHILTDSLVSLKPGDVFFINVNTPHCLTPTWDDVELTVLNCIISLELLHNIEFNKSCEPHDYIFLEEMCKEQYFSVFDRNLRIRNTFESMYDEYITKDEGYLNVMFGRVIEVIICMLREYKIQKTSGFNMSMRRESVKKALEYIEEHAEKTISLHELAKVASLSPSRFSVVFKEFTGKTVTEYIQKMRIQNVCLQLIKTDKTFSEIAYEYGYESHNFLRKIFVREMGITPNEYRQKSKSRT